jgi:hypothetical protein
VLSRAQGDPFRCTGSTTVDPSFWVISRTFFDQCLQKFTRYLKYIKGSANEGRKMIKWSIEYHGPEGIVLCGHNHDVWIHEDAGTSWRQILFTRCTELHAKAENCETSHTPSVHLPKLRIHTKLLLQNLRLRSIPTFDCPRSFFKPLPTRWSQSYPTFSSPHLGFWHWLRSISDVILLSYLSTHNWSSEFHFHNSPIHQSLFEKPLSTYLSYNATCLYE